MNNGKRKTKDNENDESFFKVIFFNFRIKVFSSIRTDAYVL